MFELEELKRDSKDIDSLYEERVAMWADVLDDAAKLSVDDLADRLGDFETRIEDKCNNNRCLSKIIMSVSGFQYLYDEQTGFGKNLKLAQKLLDAFEKSKVSSDVKIWVQTDVARLLDLDSDWLQGLINLHASRCSRDKNEVVPRT